MGAPYCGPAGAGETFYVALLDQQMQPVERLSGHFTSRDEARPVLRWLRGRNRRARLVREVTFRSIEE